VDGTYYHVFILAQIQKDFYIVRGHFLTQLGHYNGCASKS